MWVKQAGKFSLSFVRNPFYAATFVHAGKRDARSVVTRDHVRKAADWLLKAQEGSRDGDGYARTYSLAFGWDNGYIETTGYIIPTLFDVAAYLGDERYRQSALRAAEWLLAKQLPDGAIPDIDHGRPQVFDTGQVLLGFNRMIRETQDPRFMESGRKAAEWLKDGQEPDGSWLKFAFNTRPHAYYSRVGAALVEYGILAERDDLRRAGEAHLEWVIAQQQPNGYFRYSEFAAGQDAFLHTLVYVLEGLLHGRVLTGDDRWLQAAIRGGEALKGVAGGSLPHSQYDPAWTVTNREYCTTGLAQWAGVCLDLYGLTQDRSYYEQAERALEFLCGIQLTKGRDISGAFPSSVPVWGAYGDFDCYNWNNKFFIDAMLKHARLN